MYEESIKNLDFIVLLCYITYERQASADALSPTVSEAAELCSAGSRGPGLAFHLNQPSACG